MAKTEDEWQLGTHLPTSPGLIMPELTLRHGTEAAVFIILGASITITGEPISSFWLFAGGVWPSAADALDSHFTMLRGCERVLKLLETLKEEMEVRVLMLGREIGVVGEKEAAIGIVSYHQCFESMIYFGNGY